MRSVGTLVRVTVAAKSSSSEHLLSTISRKFVKIVACSGQNGLPVIVICSGTCEDIWPVGPSICVEELVCWIVRKDLSTVPV